MGITPVSRPFLSAIGTWPCFRLRGHSIAQQIFKEQRKNQLDETGFMNVHNFYKARVATSGLTPLHGWYTFVLPLTVVFLCNFPIFHFLHFCTLYCLTARFLVVIKWETQGQETWYILAMLAFPTPFRSSSFISSSLPTNQSSFSTNYCKTSFCSLWDQITFYLCKKTECR